MAKTHTLPTRRSLLGAAAAAPLAALAVPAVAAVAPAGGDAELLRVAAVFQHYHDRYLELTLLHGNVAHIPRSRCRA